MEKSRIIKPIAFNIVKDADLLEWIKTVEKTEKLNYASYVRQLINQDMLKKKNGNVVIAGSTITTPENIDYNKMVEYIQTAVKQVVNNNMNTKTLSDQVTISTMNSNININNVESNNENIKTSDLDDDDLSNLNDIMNGNF